MLLRKRTPGNGELLATSAKTSPKQYHTFSHSVSCPTLSGGVDSSLRSINHAWIASLSILWCSQGLGNQPRDGKTTVALPGVVTSPFAFSIRISQSTQWSSPSTYFLVTFPRHCQVSPS